MSRRQFTFYHKVPRKSWYSSDWPWKDGRVSWPWSHSVVLNKGPLDWESSALTIRAQERATGNRVKLCFQKFFIIKINYCKTAFTNILPRVFCSGMWYMDIKVFTHIPKPFPCIFSSFIHWEQLGWDYSKPTQITNYSKLFDSFCFDIKDWVSK